MRVESSRGYTAFVSMHARPRMPVVLCARRKVSLPSSPPPGTIVTSLVPHQVLGGVPLTTPHRLSINQAGDITGSYTDTAGVQHGFVRNPYGTLTSFDPPEGEQTTATSINDTGAIAGFYHYHAGGGPPVGFIRVP
jgi:hypothetical protein